MEPQPAPIGPRDALRLSEKRDEQQKNEIGVDLRLELEVAREILRANLARAILELERGVQRVIDFFDEHDEGPNVAIAQTGARIVPFELFDQPARIINADVKPIVRAAQKSAGQFAQLAAPKRPARHRQLRAAVPIDQAIFQIDPDLRVGALEQAAESD